MRDIVIYKSMNNGLGGDFDTTNSLSIFETDLKYTCFYVKNESARPKTILNINSNSLDSIQIGIQTNGTDIILNQISPIVTEPPINVSYSDNLQQNLSLKANEWFTLWVKLDSESTNIKTKRNLSLVVEWVNEY